MQLSGVALQAQPLVILSDKAPTLNVETASMTWIDQGGQADITQITALQRDMVFLPGKADTVYALGPKAALWQHYRFVRSADTRQNWVIEFPLPLLDRVAVFQTAGSGRWRSQSAGDHLTVASWPQPGRYGQFALDLPDGVERDVYVRIQNETALSVAARVSNHTSQIQRLQLEYLTVGVVFGALLFLVVTCATQCWVFRDVAYGWYALYAATLTLVVAAWTGVAGHLLWNQSSTWNDMAPGFLGVFAGSAGLLMACHLCAKGQRTKWFALIGRWIGLAGLPIAVVYSLVDRSLGVPVVAAYLAVVVVASQMTAFLAWRRRDAVGPWVMGAFAPMSIAVFLLVLNVLGYLPSSWSSRYGLMVGLAIEVPLLLVALNIRSRQRHTVETRAHALYSHDALTGLLAAHIFQDRCKQIVSRARRRNEDAAVIYIELVNHAYIKKNWGAAVAEQSLLRSVIKLRRIVRDVDTVGRIDEARFGLILEGASTRTQVTALGARLIATGLMPLKGLKPEVLLQFNIAAVLLGERQGTGEEISLALDSLLSGMRPRTRRPIRFLKPDLTRPVTLHMDLNMDMDLDISEPGTRAAGQTAQTAQAADVGRVSRLQTDSLPLTTGRP